jgi:pyridoxine 4-dehydrogenase
MIWIMLIAGRRVAGIGLGTAPFAFGGGTFADSVATVHAALDAGVRLVDTALAYTRADAESYAEQVIATALLVAAKSRALLRHGRWRMQGRGSLRSPIRRRPTRPPTDPEMVPRCSG